VKCMDLFSPETLSALLSIIVIDLVLAGDNAIVIGLAARRLPREHQRKVVFWGTVGAIVIRAIATVGVVWLLKIPGLLLIGGLLLLWIAYKLLVEDKNHEDVKAGESIWAAVRTIIIADAVMGIDNVLAVAGAAHDNIWLVIIGLVISIPIVVWGSTMILKLVDRFPQIIYIGAAVLVYTAASMILDEPMIAPYLPASSGMRWVIILTMVIAVLGIGYAKKNAQRTAR